MLNKYNGQLSEKTVEIGFSSLGLLISKTSECSEKVILLIYKCESSDE